MTVCLQVDLGLVPYAEAYELQKRIVAARKLGAIEDAILFCEHPPVITQGRNGKREHLLASENVLRQKGVEFFETSRGGDVTYHGPGQIVAYPILNLGAIRRDVVWYVRQLEEAMIRATAEFGIAAGREAGKTGVWAGEDKASEKLGAIGVHISRWVTSHGLAYNVSTDLRNFELIVPCGIADRKATSLEKLLGRSVKLAEVKPKLAKYLGDVFGFELKEISPVALLEKLEKVDQPVAATA
ncbi:MAG: lipoyl(octanoyl) transferase LipB [Acidobacteria bacterium]|nr:lipoyl(octanoyl) transferase LipB [Acidobacteriota bacterium]MBS1866593.1 lipoyl(octanoyl) transferase LipB [Acidobacteriota bacterium]